MLVEFIKNNRGNKIGCVVAVDRDSIGISLLNPKDKFDSEVAKSLAAGRALSGVYPQIMSKRKRKIVSKAVNNMTGRAYRYFKKDYEEIF